MTKKAKSRICLLTGASLLAFGAFGVGTVALLSVAGAAEIPWQEELTDEILDVHDCDVSFITHVVEREIKGGRIIMAKVHCEDKRSFDAYRPNDLELFKFTECTSPKTKTC